MGLSAKQQMFIEAYLTTWNATEAAAQAGYRGNRNVLAVTGHDLLRNPKIEAVIQARVQEKAMGADEVLMRLADQARSSMGDFAKISEDGIATLDLQGAALLGKLNLIHKIKSKVRTYTLPAVNENEEDRAVTEVETEVELYNAQSALALLGKNHKLFTEKVEHDGEINIKVHYGDDGTDDSAA